MAASLQTGFIAYLADRKPSPAAALILACGRFRGRSLRTTIAVAGNSARQVEIFGQYTYNTRDAGPSDQPASNPGPRAPTGENMTTTKKNRAIVGTLLASAASIVGMIGVAAPAQEAYQYNAVGLVFVNENP